MALTNGYAQYNNSKVMTASPAELTLMLYEGAIRFCNMAINGIEQTDNNIVKAENIIDYLQATLDMKYPVAEHFNDIYNYLQQRLVQANLKKDVEILQEVCEHIRSVRDTWKEVMRINREKGKV